VYKSWFFTQRNNREKVISKKMAKLLKNSMLAAAACAVLAVLPATGQAPAAYKAPRLVGRPNLNGIWQAMNSANWDLVSHASAKGPLWQNGAAGAQPPGIGIVEGDEIPYLPAALAKQKAN
jgi:hypothetical protein